MRCPSRQTATTAAPYASRKSASRIVLPISGLRLDTTASQSKRPRCFAGANSYGRISGGNEAWNLLELDDAADDAGEDQAVARLDHVIGSDRRDRRALTIDLDQEQPRQAAQAGRLDRLADQAAAG